jgi:hypothetical protein
VLTTSLFLFVCSKNLVFLTANGIFSMLTSSFTVKQKKWSHVSFSRSHSSQSTVSFVWLLLPSLRTSITSISHCQLTTSINLLHSTNKHNNVNEQHTHIIITSTPKRTNYTINKEIMFRLLMIQTVER